MADTLAPALFLLKPRPGQTDVRIDTAIILELRDTDTGVESNSVVIKVDGPTAWTGDTQQTGFTVTKVPLTDGIRYEIVPDADLPDNALVLIEVYAEDNETTPNVLDTQVTFHTGAWK